MSNYNKYPKGSEWRKWDLHFHTPSSYDYKNKNITPENIIEKLAETGVSVVAITDHHIMDLVMIRKLQELGKEKEITVLPGIEFLSDAKGKQPVHFIGIFDENSNLDYIWGQLQNKTAIHRIVGEGKAINQVYCHLAETLELIKGLGGIVTIHAGEKSNSIENITHSLPHGEAQKTDIAYAIDIYELGKEEDQAGYRDNVFPIIKKVLPMIICSDNHNINSYDIKQNCWIKADPTFEGLKQVLYEPEERVKIQANLPEDKAGYQVIDKLQINTNHIYNSILEINPNLNSIVGGRSTGKSILLAAIAKKLKTDKPVKFDHNPEYDLFVNEISRALNIFWKDGKENNEREIEYFQQSFMYDLARQDDKLSELIQDILRQKGKEAILNTHNKFVRENKKKIGDLISDFFRVLTDIQDKKQKAKERGDKKGIEDEIARLNAELKALNITTVSNDEKAIYETNKGILEQSNRNKSVINNDILIIDGLKEAAIFKENITYEVTSISETRKQAVEQTFLSLKADYESQWKIKLESIIDNAKRDEEILDREIETSSKEVNYLKVLTAFKESSQLTEFEFKIGIQKNKLFEINALLADLDGLNKQKQAIKQNIITSHKSYFVKINELLPELCDTRDGLEIKAKAKFHQKFYREILYSGLNQQGYENQAITNFEFINNDEYEIRFTDLFEKLVNNSLTLKGGYTNQSLINSLCTETFYYLNYDIEYEGDDFKKMSDGKKAFVVLKLLLDFSNKNCPILIDQPEDDLDNRSIYLDLVQYLKKKKKLRQVIVATHNPNIVVGADSELVIAANQDGLKNFNTGGKKFQYVSGSLEHTCKKNSQIQEVLECQGIREHVCEILEGGDIAFKLREKKYSLSK